MNFFKSLFITTLLVVTSFTFASSPIPMLQNAADGIISTLKQNKSALKSNPQIINAAVRKHLLPVVDVVGMSRSVLGREVWNKATSAQKQQFIEAFTKLVIRTYANPLAEYTDEQVKFLPTRGSLEGRFVNVKSVIIRSSGNNIPLNYSLVTKDGQWKVYDLNVEGVSLLQSFKNQFAQTLKTKSLSDLINQMNKTKA